MHASPDEPSRRARVDAGKVELRNGGLPRLERAEVPRPVGPAGPPAGPKQDDGAFRNRPVGGFPLREIARGDAVIPIRVRRAARVDHDRRGPTSWVSGIWSVVWRPSAK